VHATGLRARLAAAWRRLILGDGLHGRSSHHTGVFQIVSASSMTAACCGTDRAATLLRPQPNQTLCETAATGRASRRPQDAPSFLDGASLCAGGPLHTTLASAHLAHARAVPTSPCRLQPTAVPVTYENTAEFGRPLSRATAAVPPLPSRLAPGAQRIPATHASLTRIAAASTHHPHPNAASQLQAARHSACTLRMAT